MAAEYENVQGQRRQQGKEAAGGTRAPWSKTGENRPNNPFRTPTPGSQVRGQTAGAAVAPAAASQEAVHRMMAQEGESGGGAENVLSMRASRSLRTRMPKRAGGVLRSLREERKKHDRMLRARRRGKRNGAPLAGAGRRRLDSEDEAKNPLSVEEGRIVAAVTIGGRAMTATIGTGATRSCISEDCVRRQAIRGEIQKMQSRIRLADGSTLEITK
ncbi:hypothetical protein AWZ03_015314, partial [Drosophila navojoa]